MNAAERAMTKRMRRAERIAHQNKDEHNKKVMEGIEMEPVIHRSFDPLIGPSPLEQIDCVFHICSVLKSDFTRRVGDAAREFEYVTRHIKWAEQNEHSKKENFRMDLVISVAGSIEESGFISYLNEVNGKFVRGGVRVVIFQRPNTGFQWGGFWDVWQRYRRALCDWWVTIEDDHYINKPCWFDIMTSMFINDKIGWVSMSHYSHKYDFEQPLLMPYMWRDGKNKHLNHVDVRTFFHTHGGFYFCKRRMLEDMDRTFGCFTFALGANYHIDGLAQGEVGFSQKATALGYTYNFIDGMIFKYDSQPNEWFGRRGFMKNIVLLLGGPLGAWCLSHISNLLRKNVDYSPLSVICCDSESNWYDTEGMSSVFDTIRETGFKLSSIEEIQQRDVDLALSIGYGKKLSPQFIEHCKYGIINLHTAPLPEYRGRNSCAHAIINNETVFGATLHLMDDDLDTGPIIRKDLFSIPPNVTGYELYSMTMHCAFELFKSSLVFILSGGWESVDQSKLIARSRSYTKSSLKDLKLIPLKDLALPESYTLIRALDFPYFEPAHTEIEGKKVELRRNNWRQIVNEYATTTD